MANFKPIIIPIAIATFFVLGSFLSVELKAKLFLTSFIVHAISLLYIIYSVFEVKFLHEKQGSKLALSKEKLNTNY